MAGEEAIEGAVAEEEEGGGAEGEVREIGISCATWYLLVMGEKEDWRRAMLCHAMLCFVKPSEAVGRGRARETMRRVLADYGNNRGLLPTFRTAYCYYVVHGHSDR